MIRGLYNKYGKFIKFCIVGGINTVISLVVYTILIKQGMHYLGASTIGYIAGILNGYLLSSKFVFGEKLNMSKGIKFILIYLSALVINLLIMSGLIEILGVKEIPAQVIATGFNVLYNFILNNLWTFKK